jgi:hypothetical protein
MMFAKKLYAFYLVATAVALSTHEIAATSYNADAQVVIPPDENSPALNVGVIEKASENKDKKKYGEYGKKVEMNNSHTKKSHGSKDKSKPYARGKSKKKEHTKKSQGSKDKSKPCARGKRKKKEHTKKSHGSKDKSKPCARGKSKKMEHSKKTHGSKDKSKGNAKSHLRA